jgi:hypothetical protein
VWAGNIIELLESPKAAWYQLWEETPTEGPAQGEVIIQADVQQWVISSEVPVG